MNPDSGAAESSGSTRERHPPEILLDRVSKRFPEGISALESVDLTIKPGERLAVLGPSGSGKSTLLRVVAGLEPASGGRVVIGGIDQAGLPPHHRDAALIFQNPALFPHLSVFENLAFGLRARERAEVIPARVAETAAMLGLSDLLGRRPAALSGGERQRVAIGRAIAWRPRILLLDEPFSSLDAPLRASLRAEILTLHRRFGMTLIHVTHDQGEALAMGDRVAVLDRGRIVQCDTPRRVYERPAHRFIAEFVGNPPMNLLPCEIVRGPEHLAFHLLGAEPILLGIGRKPEAGPFSALEVGERRRLDLGIRPEHVSICREADSIPPLGDPGSIPARIERVEYQGHESWIHVRVGGHLVRSRATGPSLHLEGEDIRLVLDLAEASWFDPETGFAVPPDENPFAGGESAC